MVIPPWTNGGVLLQWGPKTLKTEPSPELGQSPHAGGSPRKVQTNQMPRSFDLHCQASVGEPAVWVQHRLPNLAAQASCILFTLANQSISAHKKPTEMDKNLAPVSTMTTLQLEPRPLKQLQTLPVWITVPG